MTVQELIDLLSKLDPNKQVMIWNAEWDCSDPIDYVEENKDGEIVLY